MWAGTRIGAGTNRPLLDFFYPENASWVEEPVPAIDQPTVLFEKHDNFVVQGSLEVFDVGLQKETKELFPCVIPLDAIRHV